MRLKEAIRRVDAIQPNAFDDTTKILWISEIEGKIQTELQHVQPEEAVTYTDLRDLEAELLVAFPYEKLYPLYLGAMIDYANGEFSRYQNSMAMFNAAWDEYAKWYMRNHIQSNTGAGESTPGGSTGGGGTQGPPGKNGKDGKDGLSAYELALLNGFSGTQAEWLTSLAGKTPVKGVDYFTPQELASLPYATKDELGQLGSVLDAISGEVV